MPPLDDGVESGKEIESTDEHSKQRVGYSHPPIATRFRKGQSGNPKGCPKGTKNFEEALTGKTGTEALSGGKFSELEREVINATAR
jgi:hypothetical protein